MTDVRALGQGLKVWVLGLRLADQELVCYSCFGCKGWCCFKGFGVVGSQLRASLDCQEPPGALKSRLARQFGAYLAL